MKIIDPHLHLFELAKGQYHWLKPESAPFWPDKSIIQRDFSPQDLRLPASLELAGFVHIEAGFNNQQPWLEIAWLEHYSNQAKNTGASLPFRTIGCIDLTVNSSNFSEILARLSSYSSLAGVRHILDQQAYSLLNQTQVRANITKIAAAGLLFEAQLSGCDNQGIQALITVAQAHPTLTIVLNHAGFCPARPQDYKRWQTNMMALAQHNNIFAKASGWEMVERQYQLRHIHAVIAFLIANFGNTRVMLASNFPLCLFSTGYDDLWHQYQALPLTKQQQELLLYQNAKRIYGF